jgi:putative membrane protein (TIGR04086 family)
MEKKGIEKSERAPLYNSPVGNYDGDSTRYCSVCGTRVNSSEMYCGNCGYILEGIQNSSLNNLSNNHNKKLSLDEYDWDSIFRGGVIAVVLSGFIGFISGLLLYEVPIDTFIAIAIFINILSLFIGGLYAGIKAKKSGGMHGAFAGATCAIISIFIVLFIGESLDLSSLFAILFAMLFGGIGGLVGYSVTKSSKIQPQINTQTNYV